MSEPEPSRQPDTQPTTDGRSPARFWKRDCLRQSLMGRLGDEELDGLAFDAGLDVNNKSAHEKLRLLLSYYFQHDDLAPLEKWITENRKDISLDGCREVRQSDPLPHRRDKPIDDSPGQRLMSHPARWSAGEVGSAVLVGVVWLLVWLAGDRLGVFLDESIRRWIDTLKDGVPWGVQLVTPLAWGAAGLLAGLIGGLGMAVGFDWSGSRLSPRRAITLAGGWAVAWGIGFGVTSYLAAQLPFYLNLLFGWLLAGLIGTWSTWRVLYALTRHSSWSQLVLASGAWGAGWLLYTLAVVLQLLPEDDVIRVRLFALGFAFGGIMTYMVFKQMLQSNGQEGTLS